MTGRRKTEDKGSGIRPGKEMKGTWNFTYEKPMNGYGEVIALIASFIN